ncbi:MAG: alpha/beta fold hydrolase [Intrasporangiaceae bacterium]|nr:alpha/beta fold hydrolase [Intrasporangiaceae bacterium]
MTTTPSPHAGRATVRDVSFPGATGAPLSATIELPAGVPRGYAIMAHCFTCTSRAHATSRISAGLADRGYAVLRFDFTGLGHSDGDFVDTTFTSNIGDLVAAASYLAEHWGEVGLLVGHSLGGAAVIAATASIPSVRAVVTLGAPACPDHVRHLFSDLPDDTDSADRLQVDIGGRPFVIGRDFLDDIAEQPQLERLATLPAALLVLHSPVDQIVGIDNAREIFGAARHPKSFVALDGADHLLSDREDAQFAADVIAAWARRYLPVGPEATEGEGPARDDETPGVVVTESTSDGYAHIASASGHSWVLDEPESAGGHDSGPGPYDVMLSALGACTSMTMRMYARRKGWDYGATTVTVTHTRVHAKDCEECVTEEGRIDRIDRVIDLDPDLTDERRAALLVIADKCPVHRTLTGTIEIFTRTA